MSIIVTGKASLSQESHCFTIKEYEYNCYWKAEKFCTFTLTTQVTEQPVVTVVNDEVYS